MTELERVLRYLFSSVIAVFCFVSSAFASETEWQQHQDMLQTRLISASSGLAADGKMLLAWEAKLAPGWKTYWRSPGEAGLPVRVFAGGAEQVVAYPYPERFELFGLQTYGYSKHVILPFMLDIAGSASVDVDFMVCKEICVPFRATYELTDISPDQVSIHDQKIRTWMAKVPEAAGDDGAGLEIVSAKVVGPVGKQKIIVDVKAAAALSQADMLAEVNDMFHFGKPKMKLLADGRSARFVLPAMSGKKPEDLRTLSARLTFTDGKGAAIERTIDLATGRVK